jgi:hypothetical protein
MHFGIAPIRHDEGALGRQDQLQSAVAGRYTTNRIFLPVAGSRGSPSVSLNDPHMSPL